MYAGCPVITSRDNHKVAYLLLAVLFVGTVAFQSVLLAETIRQISSQIWQFQAGAITWLDIEFFAQILTPFACLALLRAGAFAGLAVCPSSAVVNSFGPQRLKRINRSRAPGREPGREQGD